MRERSFIWVYHCIACPNVLVVQVWGSYPPPPMRACDECGDGVMPLVEGLATRAAEVRRRSGEGDSFGGGGPSH